MIFLVIAAIALITALSMHRLDANSGYGTSDGFVAVGMAMYATAMVCGIAGVVALGNGAGC